MRQFIRLAASLAIVVALIAPVHAQSTINENIPITGAPLQSAPMRNNFAAAASDINAIIAGHSQSSVTTCPTGYVFEDCLVVGTSPYQWYKWVGSTGVRALIGYLDPATGVYTAPISSTNLVVTSPVTVSFSGPTATIGLTTVPLSLGGLGGSQAAATPGQVPVMNSGATAYVPGIYGGTNWYANQFGISASNSDMANSTGFAAALTAINAAGGGVLTLPCGTYQIASTIDNQYSQILVTGPASTLPTFHDLSGPNYCVTITPTFAGTVLKHRTPYNGVLQSVNSGGGFANMRVLGNSIATRLLEVDTVRGGIYHLNLVDSVGSESVLFTSGITGTDVGEAADVQYADIDLFCRQLDGAPAQAATCYKLSGSSNANFSFNVGAKFSCQITNGHCVDAISADNNDIASIRVVVTGTGQNLILRGNTAAHPVGGSGNTIWHITGTGATYAEGTDTGGVTSGVSNIIYSVDTENGTPAPTAGTGSYFPYTDNSAYVSQGLAVSHQLVTDQVGAANVNAQRAALAATTSQTISNGSSDNLRITNGTQTWGINNDGAHLRINSVSGGDYINLGNGAPAQILGGITAAASLGLRDGATYDTTISATSSSALTAARAVTVDVVNGSRTLKLGANLTIATDPGAVTGAIKSDGSGTFAQAACSDLSGVGTGCSATIANYMPLAGGTFTGGIGFSTTNTLDIGTNATTLAPRTIYAGTSFVGPVGTFTTSMSAPITIGGAAASSSLTLESTSGTGTSDSIVFKTGSQSTRWQIDTSGHWAGGANTSNPNDKTMYVAIPNSDSGTDGIEVRSANNKWYFLSTGMGAGSLNNIVQAGDSGIIFSNNASDTGNFVIAPWATGAGGMRINNVGNASFPATTVSTSKTTGNIVNLGGFGNAGAIFTDTLNVITMAADTAQTDATVCRVAATGLLYTGTGALGICLGTSGRQFKTAFAPMVAGIDDLMKIDFVNYRYLDGYGDNGAHKQYGTTAQNVEAVLPDIARHDVKGETINYDSGALLFIGLHAIQQLKADNDNMRAEINELKRATR